jgi:predicted nuclease of predicted toxin-antitoxin system
VTKLKSKGISIIHAHDINKTGISDRQHLKISKRLNRVLITLDRDFLGYTPESLVGHPGVIVISTGTAVSLEIDKICEKMIHRITSDFAKESLITVTKVKITKKKT